MLKLEVDDNLARALIALDQAEAGTADAMRASADAEIDKTWSTALMNAAGTTLERRMIADGADADVENVGFTLWAGLGGPVSGGLGRQDRDWAGVEFGMTPFQSFDTKRRRTIRIAGTGTVQKVATGVWVGRNLKPRNAQGYVAMPTVRKYVPQYVASWVHGLIGQFDAVNDTALDIGGD